MKKYILKISRVALYAVLALSLSQTENLSGNSNPVQSFIDQELCLINKKFDYIIKWYNNLFLSNVKYNTAADQLKNCVVRAEKEIILPMRKNHKTLATRSSNIDGQLLDKARDLIENVYQILENFSQTIDGLVGCKERMRFVRELQNLENTLSSRLIPLGASLNQFHTASKQHNALYVKQIENLKQKMQNLDQLAQNVSPLVVYKRICTFVKE